VLVASLAVLIGTAVNLVQYRDWKWICRQVTYGQVDPLTAIVEEMLDAATCITGDWVQLLWAQLSGL